ncbi:MAG: DNA helicase PcrA [Bacillota bacterium]
MLEGLNKAQAEAVMQTEGPLLIIAGAGSGKTRVLTNRIAYLLDINKAQPWQILAITFTNKAANEMKERVLDLIGAKAGDMWISTFHSACVKILRRHASELGFKSNFVIYDTSDKETLLKNCLKESNLNPKEFSPKSIGETISQAKNQLLNSHKYSRTVDDFYKEVVLQVYKLYEQKLEKNNAFDFDDLLMKTVELFRFNEDILDFYQKKFVYILIDEYQDTNHAQYVLVNLLAKKHKNLCVVGDPDQSIYRWRGADINNILSFQRDYPEAKVVKLEQNYRSTACILDAANAMIKNNKGRKEKKLWTENPKGEQLTLLKSENERDEAEKVVSEVLRLKLDNKYNLRDMAVLYRTHSQSRALEEELVRNNMPYQIFGGIKFYERKEIKDILAYLKVLVNKDDTVSLTRIINVPKRGLGTTSWSRVEEYAAQKAIPLFDALKQPDIINDLSARARKQLSSFYELMQRFGEAMDEFSVKDLTSYVLSETGYWESLQEEDTPEAEARIENLKEFLNVAAAYDRYNPSGSLEEFLAEISLVADIDQYNADDDLLVLMTLHTAKGLEYPVVFMIGMEEGLFPHFKSLENDYELEEERRLCYVGMTRAKEKLYLSFAKMRMIYGETIPRPISRFLQEIPAHLLDEPLAVETADKVDSVFMSRPAREKPTPMSYTLGDKVFHNKWGEGVVVQVNPGDTLIKVAFPEQGIKSLDVCFAPLRVINKK